MVSVVEFLREVIYYLIMRSYLARNIIEKFDLEFHEENILCK